MRIPALAVFAILSAAGGAAWAGSDSAWHAVPNLGLAGYTFETGAAATAGMTADTATYLRRGGYNSPNEISKGAIERSLPLDGWRGKRLRLSLRLKEEGEGTSLTGVNIYGEGSRTYIVSAPQKSEPGGQWRAHQFVLDVPDDATKAVIRVSLNISGRQNAVVWVEDVALEGVAADVAVTDSRRTPIPEKSWGPLTF